VPDRSKKVGRREVLTTIAAGMAGAVAAPGLSAQESHAHTDGTQAATSQAAATDQPPRILDEHRRKMLDGLAEQLLPGSRAAGVPDLLDRVLAVEPANAQRRFLNALGAFDREARDRHARGWLEITGDRQIEIVRAASILAPSRPPAPGWKRGDPVDRPAAPATPANLRDHFEHLRDWIQRAYYTTAAGMKELGFTGRMAFPNFPGCPHPGNDHR
jgi:hypothetical protein